MRFELRPGIRRLFRLEPRGAAGIHRDIDDELESVIANRVDDLVARGMAPDAARAEALRRLGASVDDARRQLHQSAEYRERRMHFHEHVDDFLQDVRYAARGLVRRPAFTAVAVLTLAIGIGATTAIFSAVNVLLLRPLPWSKPDELMRLWLVAPSNGRLPGSDHVVWSYPKFAAFRNSQRAFSSLALHLDMQLVLTSGEIEYVRGETVSASYLRTLGVRVAYGRDFDLSVDDHPGSPREAILSYRFWQDRFAGDPHAIGKTIELRDKPYTIIGVTEPGFTGLSGQASIFTPIMTRNAASFTEPFSHEFNLIGRLAPGVTPAQAAAMTATLGSQIDRQFTDTLIAGRAWGARAIPLDATRVAPAVRRAMLILFGAVVFVLLIACVNVANLLIGQAAARRREIAVRLAIGASRTRLVRLLVTESVVLALLGGTLGIFVAWAGTHAISTVNPASAFRSQRLGGLGAVGFSSISLDGRALGFALVLTLGVGLLFGLVPALAATRSSLADTLKAGADDIRRGATRLRGRRALVVAEMALAMMLLAGSGLMIRSLINLLHTDDGFDARNVLTARFTAFTNGSIVDSLPGYYDRLAERLRAVPGVTAVGVGDCPPLTGGCGSTVVMSIDGVTIGSDKLLPIDMHWANGEWFSALRIPVLRGRVFDATDRAGTPRVVVINDAAARAFFPNENPVGHRIGVGRAGLASGAEIIGVIGNARQLPDSAIGPEIYTAVAQYPLQRLYVAVRTGIPVDGVTSDVRRAMRESGIRAGIDEMQTMSFRVATATAQTRSIAVLLGLFAATALALAVVGIYGVMSLAVSSRTREMGIRIALGADRHRVQRLVIGEGLSLVAVGAILGLVAALFATRVLSTMLYDLAANDPATYVGVAGVLTLTAVLASWIPARRASRVDPVQSLRSE